MKKTRRNFILIGAVSLTGLIAGCVGSDQSGSEPTSQDPMTSDTQSVSETPTNTRSSTTKLTSGTRTDTSTSTPNASTETTSEITRATSLRVTQTSVTGTVSHALRDVRIYNETSTTLKLTVTISRLPLSWGGKPPENLLIQRFKKVPTANKSFPTHSNSHRAHHRNINLETIRTHSNQRKPTQSEYPFATVQHARTVSVNLETTKV